MLIVKIRLPIMHPLLRFAYKNLIKSKIRSGLSILAVFLGVLLITTLLIMTDSLVAAVDDSLDLLSGVVVVQQENAVDPNFSLVDRDVLDNLTRANDQGGVLEGKIESIAEEIWWVERSDTSIFGFTQVIGVIPSQEKTTVGVLKPENILEGGRTLNDDDVNATVVGTSVASLLQLEVGDFVKIAKRNIEIVGIFETDSFIDNSYFMPFDLVQQFSPQFSQANFVSTLLVKPVDLEAGGEIKEYVNSVLIVSDDVEASDFEEIAEQGREFLKITTDFAFYLGLISIIIGSLTVFNAILMSVFERIREIAILKATGWSDNEVVAEVFTESLFIAVIGGIFGVLGGIGISWYVTSISQFLDLVVLPSTLIKSYFYAVLLGIFAGLYPAFRAMQIDPVKDLTG